MRNSRRIAGRSAWSALAASVTVATLAASLTGCGKDTEPQATPSYALNGVYRLVGDGAKQTLGGAPDPGPSMQRQFALRSHCGGETCVTIGMRLDDKDASKPFEDGDGKPDEPMVADYRDGRWFQVEQAEWTCGDGSVGRQTVYWSLTPQSDGSLTGTRTDIRVASPQCVSVQQLPITVTRTGDIDPAISLGDPAAVPPWRASSPARLSGKYTRTAVQVQAGSEIDRTAVEFTSFCVRNTNNCVALKSFTEPDGPRLVPLEFDNGRWTVQFDAMDTECPESKQQAQVISHEQYALPTDASNPIQNTTGSEVAVVTGACTGVLRDFNLALQRSEG